MTSISENHPKLPKNSKNPKTPNSGELSRRRLVPGHLVGLPLSSMEAPLLCWPWRNSRSFFFLPRILDLNPVEWMFAIGKFIFNLNLDKIIYLCIILDDWLFIHFFNNLLIISRHVAQFPTFTVQKEKNSSSEFICAVSPRTVSCH